MGQKPRLAPAALNYLSPFLSATTSEIAAAVFANLTAMRRSLKQLHSEGKIRIFDWQRSGQLWVPVWILADGLKDEPKPKPQTQAVKSRTHRAKRPDKFARRALAKDWVAQLHLQRKKGSKK